MARKTTRKVHVKSMNCRPSAKDDDGKTALMSAVDSDSAEIVQYLLEHGATVNPALMSGIKSTTRLHLSLLATKKIDPLV